MLGALLTGSWQPKMNRTHPGDTHTLMVEAVFDDCVPVEVAVVSTAAILI